MFCKEATVPSFHNIRFNGVENSNGVDLAENGSNETKRKVNAVMVVVSFTSSAVRPLYWSREIIIYSYHRINKLQ